MGLFGPNADKILTRGSVGSGTLIGIDVTYNHDDPPRRLDTYAIRLDDGTILGVRQRLSPDSMVRLGMRLVVRVVGGDAVIDWAATGSDIGFAATTNTSGWKSVKDAPAAGIVEDKVDKLRRKATTAWLDIASISERSRFAGLATSTMLDVIVHLPGDSPYSANIKLEVDYYAAHLPVVGARLPCLVRMNKLHAPTIDWPSAAMATPGVGQPPVQLGSAGGTNQVMAVTWTEPHQPGQPNHPGG